MVYTGNYRDFFIGEFFQRKKSFRLILHENFFDQEKSISEKNWVDKTCEKFFWGRCFSMANFSKLGFFPRKFFGLGIYVISKICNKNVTFAIKCRKCGTHALCVAPCRIWDI